MRDTTLHRPERLRRRRPCRPPPTSCVLASVAMRDRDLRRARRACRGYRLPVAGTVHNTDTLLGTHGFVGIKTGSDDAAGGCFMFRAVRIVHGRTGDRDRCRARPARPQPDHRRAVRGAQLVDRITASNAQPCRCDRSAPHRWPDLDLARMPNGHIGHPGRWPIARTEVPGSLSGSPDPPPEDTLLSARFPPNPPSRHPPPTDRRRRADRARCVRLVRGTLRTRRRVDGVEARGRAPAHHAATSRHAAAFRA